MMKNGFLARAAKQWTVFPGAHMRLERAKELIETKDFRKGLRRLDKMAQDGDADAQYLLGDIYLTGRQVPLNPRQAVFWLRKAAKNGQADAIFKIAILYHSGFQLDQDAGTNILSVALEQGEPDHTKAFDWALRAAEMGQPDAMALVAHILTHGPDEMRDISRARAFYEKSASLESVHGLQGYALALLEENASDDARAQALGLLDRASGMGSGQADYLLGLLNEEEGREAQAFQFFTQAAEKDIMPAQMKLGVAYYQGRGVERDLVKAETWLRKAAMSGDVEAAALVGDINLQGDGRSPNFIEAANWYRKAVEGGHVAAMVTLGQLTYNGAGTPKNVEEAEALFALAAGKGSEPASQLLKLLQVEKQAKAS